MTAGDSQLILRHHVFHWFVSRRTTDTVNMFCRVCSFRLLRQPTILSRRHYYPGVTIKRAGEVEVSLSNGSVFL